MMYKNASGPFFVMFDITTACNFQCLHCYNSSGKRAEDEMTDKEIIDVAQQIADMHPKSVCLCGGETMVRSNILDIISVLAPNVGVVNMVSNGSLLNETNVNQLMNAGIKSIQISLDGINAFQHDTFRGYSGSFDKAINAIKIIRNAGLEVYISFVPNKLNNRTIYEFFELTHDLGVASTRIMPLIPMGRGNDIEHLLLNAEEYIELQLAIEANKVKYNNKMHIEWGDPLDHLRRMPNNEAGGYKSIQLDIRANGNITISPYLNIVTGNIRKHKIKDYWENGYNDIWYNKEIKKYLDQIETIYDINKLKLSDGEDYYIDIIKKENN